jgi:hypothetical protein
MRATPLVGAESSKPVRKVLYRGQRKETKEEETAGAERTFSMLLSP